MKAIRLPEFGGPDAFRAEEMPDPVAGPGEVLVRIRASGLNPVDSYARQGFTGQMFPMVMPAVLGCDGAGTVEAVGEGVTAFAAGDRVAIHLPPGGKGTHADLAVAPVEGIARIPNAMSFEEAATLPLAGLTGRQLVETLGDVGQGARVLVAGALGAVGRAAVQYLKEIGAVPVAGVRAERLAEGEALAGEAVDMATLRPHCFDLAIAVANAASGQAVGALRDGGRMASAVQVPEDANPDGRVSITNILTHDDGATLQAVIDAGARGDLRIPVAETFPLDDLAGAHRALDAHPAGKVIVAH